jgi:DNA-binding transcriptional regulator YdaS (Cro superfamily)
MKLSDYLSGARGLARALAKTLGVDPVMVSEWRTGKKRVPAERCPSIEKATNGAVRCEDLRPDVDWGYLRGQKEVA